MYNLGIGIVSTAVVSLIILMYNTLNSWTLLYFFKSFHSTLPWTKCTNVSQNCREIYYEQHIMKLKISQIDNQNSTHYLNESLTKQENKLLSDGSTFSTSDFFQ